MTSDVETTLRLLERAREQITEAYAATVTSTRYLDASLAALQAAAAVLSSHGTRSPRSVRTDTWEALVIAAPELAEWAEVFAAVTSTRIAVETGTTRVSVRTADDLVRAAEEFVEQVGTRLGVPRHPHRLRLAPARTA